MKCKTVKSSVVMYEVWQEEQRELLKRIALRTGQGKINWICTEYYPLSFTDRCIYDESPAYLSQIYVLATRIDGIPYRLVLIERITLPNGKGNISVTLTRDLIGAFYKIEDSLAYDWETYDDCAPEEIASVFKSHPVMMLYNAIVPQIVDCKAVKEAFKWARFTHHARVSRSRWNHPLVRLGEKLFKDHRVLDCHQIVFDTQYREQLLSE